MTDLRILLEKANIRSVLVVDDAYDQVPLPSDLSPEADEWTQFFDDLNDEDTATIRKIYPRYDDARADELRMSEEFVAALWQHRSHFRTEIVRPLFARYDSGAAEDLEYLAALVERLDAFGLACTTAGRSFQDKAGAADLIVIDLFLGSTQGEADSTVSIDGLTKVIANRPGRPPVVILMSRSPRLDDKREEFRDSVGLFESAFRIIRKAELTDTGKLQRLLTRLAAHYADSLKLASFLCAWNEGLNQARKRTSKLIRTLDLADYAQVRQLLLSAEGEPTGSYLVDVFDRVLQHEIESEAPIIDAAIALNALTSETYPPPYVAGSRNLQDIVHRSLFQNRERLRLINAEGSRVAFGDLLRRKAAPASVGIAAAPDVHSPLSDISAAEVLAVLTPACDLQRQGAKRILLLVGTLRPLHPADWIYKEEPIRTPVIQLAEGQPWWIKWDLKHIETLSHEELKRILEAVDGFEVIARLRESHSLELQQRLLSNLGRVGLIAPMPATFPMRVEAYLPDTRKKLVLLDIPALAQEGGVCYVGRADQGARLVLCEDACEAICEVIEKIDPSRFHENAQETIAYLRTSGELAQVLEHGVRLPNSGGQKEILLRSGGLQGEGPNPRSIGFVMRNKDIQDAEVKKAGLVLATWEDPTEPKIGRPGTAEHPGPGADGQEFVDSEIA